MRPIFVCLGTALVGLGIHACSSDPAATTATRRADSGTDTGVDGDAPTPADAATPATSKVVTTTEAIMVDGVARQYMLSVPKTYSAARAYPLLLMLHGDGDSDDSFARLTQMGEVTGGDAIVAYPNKSEELFTPYDQNVDQRLIEVTVDAIKAKLNVDAAKVWGFGYSKGAFQLNEIACKKPGLLKAFVSHAGGAPQTRDGAGAVVCPAAIAIPAFLIHGADDDLPGGQFQAQYWASVAGCQTTSTATTPAGCVTFDACPGATPVRFCILAGWGHAYSPGSTSDAWAWLKTL